jgi:hypothetical protein
MTFAVTRCVATGAYNSDTVKNRGLQRVELTCTAAATDVAYDIATTGGTFWTAVGGTAPGNSAKALLFALVGTAYAGKLVGVRGTFAQAYLRGATAASGVYTQSVTGELPIITFDTANGPTSIIIVLDFVLPLGVAPITADYAA